MRAVAWLEQRGDWGRRRDEWALLRENGSTTDDAAAPRVAALEVKEI